MNPLEVSGVEFADMLQIREGYNDHNGLVKDHTDSFTAIRRKSLTNNTSRSQGLRSASQSSLNSWQTRLKMLLPIVEVF